MLYTPTQQKKKKLNNYFSPSILKSFERKISSYSESVTQKQQQEKYISKKKYVVYFFFVLSVKVVQKSNYRVRKKLYVSTRKKSNK